MAKEKTTVQISKKWNRIHNLIKYGKFVIPFVPVGVVTGVNAEEWWGKQGWTMPLGLGVMLLAILITLLAYFKKDVIKNEKYSFLFYIAGIIAVWAVSLILLANILNQIAFMLLYVDAGIFGSAGLEQFDNTTVTNRIKEYNGLIDEFNLDEKKRKQNKKKEERRIKAEQEAKELEQRKKRAVD